MKSDVSDK